MSGGGGEPAEGEEELGAVVENIGKGGGKTKVVGFFFMSVVQEIFLFGLVTLVMTPSMDRYLGGFQHRLARHVTGRKPRKLPNGSWEYPPLDTEV